MIRFNTNGFTLIEILVVVVIISILTTMGVQIISSGSVERNLKQHGKILQSSLEYSCDQATFQNRAYGIKFHKTGYQFSQLVNRQWVDESSEYLNASDYKDGSNLSLEVDGQKLVLPEEIDDIPQLICDSSGKLTPFVLHIFDSSQKHHYQLESIGFWQVQGQWIDENKS